MVKEVAVFLKYIPLFLSAEGNFSMYGPLEQQKGLSSTVRRVNITWVKVFWIVPEFRTLTQNVELGR